MSHVTAQLSEQAQHGNLAIDNKKEIVPEAQADAKCGKDIPPEVPAADVVTASNESDVVTASDDQLPEVEVKETQAATHILEASQKTFGWLPVDDNEHATAISCLLPGGSLTLHSKPTKLKIDGQHVVNTVSVFRFQEGSETRDFIGGRAVMCVDEQGQLAKGCLVFVYYSRTLSSGSKYGLVVFSLSPLRYTISHLHNRNTCYPVVPHEKCSDEGWQLLQKLPVVDYLREKHSDRLIPMTVVSPDSSRSKRKRRPVHRYQDTSNSQSNQKTHKCNQCKKAFATSAALKCHVTKNHSVKQEKTDLKHSKPVRPKEMPKNNRKHKKPRTSSIFFEDRKLEIQDKVFDEAFSSSVGSPGHNITGTVHHHHFQPSPVSEQNEDISMARFIKIQQPVLSLLRETLEVTRVASAAAAVVGLSGHVAGSQAAVSGFETARQEYKDLMSKYPTLSSLKWADFVTLTSSEYNEWISEDHVSFGDKRALQRLLKENQSA